MIDIHLQVDVTWVNQYATFPEINKTVDSVTLCESDVAELLLPPLETKKGWEVKLQCLLNFSECLRLLFRKRSSSQDKC